MTRFLLFLLGLTLVVLATLYSVREWVLNQAVQSTFVEDRSPHLIVVGNERLKIPLNIIRHARQRTSATAQRVDLAVHWPSGLGYTADLRAAFDRSTNELVRITITSRNMTLGMSDRLADVYAELLQGDPMPGPNGLLLQRLKDDSGYDNEALAIAVQENAKPWVARCPIVAETGFLSGTGTCLHDFLAGETLSVSYRFQTRHLPDWKRLDGMVRKLVVKALNEAD